MTTSNVRVNPALVKAQMKCAKISPQMLSTLCGYKNASPTTFRYWMANEAVPAVVAQFLTDKLKFKLND